MHIVDVIIRVCFIIVSFLFPFHYGKAQIERIVADDQLQGALISAVLVDAITGERLEEFQPNALACPASVWKLMTTAAALSKLGPDFKFTTVLAYTGEIESGVLKGDLIIIGSGDPTLGSRHFQHGLDEVLDQWVTSVKAFGIDSITGNVIGNGAHLKGQPLPRTRIWEDIGNYYGSGIFGLNFNDNTYFLSFSTPDEPEEQATLLNVYPEVPDLTITSEVQSSTIQSDQAYIFGSPLSNKRVVRGTLPLGRDRFVIKGSIPDPALFAAYHLKIKLEESEVGVGGVAQSETEYFREPITYKKIDEVLSPSVSEIVSHTNRESDNLMAEGLLIQLGAKAGEPSLEKGIEELTEFLKGIWGENSHFFAYDGSGLSRFNAVSAGQIADLLVRANRIEMLKTNLLEPLPKAGKDGSVKWFGLHTNLARNARLKSGSMENVRAYAGIFTTYTGRELIFAIEVNNYSVSGVEVRKKVEDWLVRAYGRY